MSIDGDFINTTLKKLLVIFVFLAGIISYAMYEHNKLMNFSNTTVDASLVKGMPELSVRYLNSDREKFSFKKISGKKLVFVHLWATWCTPCKDELPMLLKFADGLGDSEIEFVFIAVNDNDLAVNKFLGSYKKADTKISFLVDDDGSASKLFNTYQVPETFLFSSKGALINKFIGSQNWSSPALLERIKYWKSL